MPTKPINIIFPLLTSGIPQICTAKALKFLTELTNKRIQLGFC
ncbi:unnamed protein product [Moneuplotes crassus]|uniref:Uncharacterized protein n=1 Tax=Euplotes crassus TaxID=5936 RepID=A0AAD1XS59_EUPCR|nr:unnamed protein product [Moneuplotes crassus]